LTAENVFKQELGTLSSARPKPKGRPTATSIFEVLGDWELLEASEACLRESTYVAMATYNFPLLSYVNEPISHLTSPTVRPLVQLLADSFHESCCTPQNITMAYEHLSPYVSNTSQITQASLSTPIPLERIVANDGDGIVELTDNPEEHDPLNNAVYHRLHGIDAPELYCTSFINFDGKVLKRHNGHLSHLGVHYYLNSFGRPRGTSVICKEMSRFGHDTPKDIHKRELSVFWLVWLQKPSSKELVILDQILSSVEGLDDTVRGSLMSINIDPREADTDNPFLLNLNALLVLSGFAHVYTK